MPGILTRLRLGVLKLHVTAVASATVNAQIVSRRAQGMSDALAIELASRSSHAAPPDHATPPLMAAPSMSDLAAGAPPPRAPSHALV